MIGDGWSPADHDGWQDAPRPEAESTQVDQPLTLAQQALADRVIAIRSERRAAYLGGVPNRHHPDL